MQPGTYRLKDMAAQCKIRPEKLSWLVRRHSHPQVITERSFRGYLVTITILPPTITVVPTKDQYPSPYPMPSNPHALPRPIKNAPVLNTTCRVIIDKTLSNSNT